MLVKLEQPAFGVVSSITYPRSWHSTFAVSLGGAYRLNDQVSLMTGYLYGFNPVPDRTLDPSIPDADTHLFCVGGELRMNSLTLALAYAYQLQAARDRAPNLYGSLVSGTYNAHLHLVGISLGYRF